MVRGFDRDHICAEIRTEQEGEGSNHAGALGFATRQCKLGEVLVRSQNYQMGPENHSENKANLSFAFVLVKWSVVSLQQLKILQVKIEVFSKLSKNLLEWKFTKANYRLAVLSHQCTT